MPPPLTIRERLVEMLMPGLRGDVEILKLEVEAHAHEITQLQLEQERLMATQAEFDERMSKMDAATTEIATDLQKLRDELAAGGAISEANLALLDAKIARLTVLGADPENPVPPLEPNPITE